MSNVPAGKRKSAPKGRLGCTTCKARHVRCDERKPRCTPCEKSSRHCEYSSDRVRPTPDQLKVIMWQPTGLAIRQLSLTAGHTSHEGRSLEFFRVKVAMDLSGFFDSSFWTQDVLQVAQHEPSVRHGVVALASLSETLLRTKQGRGNGGEGSLQDEDDKQRSLPRSRAPSPETFAIRQHAKAVSALTKKMQDGVESSPETVLITCALFICFDMLQNNFEAAVRQMSSGVFVFCEWYSKHRIAAKTAYPQLVGLAYHLKNLFERLLSQTILFIDTNIQEWQFLEPQFTPDLPIIPPAFKSIDEARDCLNAYRCCVYHKIITSQMQDLSNQGANKEDSNSDIFPAEPPQVEDDPHQAWELAFEAFLRHPRTILSPREQQAAVLLEIQHISGSILAAAGMSGQEIVFDRFEASFSKIVSLVSGLTGHKGQHLQESAPAFPAFDMGTLPPLYFTASRCRQPSIRRQALHLLTQGPIQEGIWHSGMLSNIAKHIMNKEEAACVDPLTCNSSDIAATARISVLNAKINSAQRTVNLYYCRPQAEGMNEMHVLHELVTY